MLVSKGAGTTQQCSSHWSCVGTGWEWSVPGWDSVLLGVTSTVKY